MVSRAQARQLSEIAYGALTPERGETQNLLVPVCASFTHIAYSTYRLEPQFAIFGQSAAVAAVLAIRAAAGGGGNGPAVVQDVDIATLQAELRAQGVLIDALPMPAPGPLSLAACGSAPNSSVAAQLFRHNVSDGSLRCGGLCAGVFAYSNSTGAAVVLAKCHTTDPSQPGNEAFDVIEAPPAAGVLVRSRMSGLCVAPASPAGLEQRDCAGSAGVRWLLPASPQLGVWQQADSPSLCVTASVD